MKICTKCSIEKEESHFGKRYDYPTKLLSWCKECERTRKTEAARKRFTDPASRANETQRQKLWRYGLTPTAYSQLVDQHGGRCAVCNTEADLRIDHDHTTGKVRGLLCHHCNVALGHFKDSIPILNNAIDYLCKNKNPNS